MGDSWTVEVASDEIERFLRNLPEYEQVVLDAAVTKVLAIEGPAIGESEWGKALGRGLYEFRIRKSLDAILKSRGVAQARGGKRSVLLRVFCAFERGRVVLLLGGYDKGKESPSPQHRAFAYLGDAGPEAVARESASRRRPRRHPGCPPWRGARQHRWGLPIPCRRDVGHVASPIRGPVRQGRRTRVAVLKRSGVREKSYVDFGCFGHGARRSLRGTVV